VVLSVPQLAAVSARGSISQTEMLTNRLWGGLQVVGGVLEMAGAAALCVLPEPTMASKAGCIVFGVHGSDTAAAGLRQVWTARDTATLTQRGTVKLAETMKASPDMANSIGLSLDMIVPFGFAGSIRAARVARVTMGRINLKMHEGKAGSRLGGHTILKHVGRTEAQLRQRLIDEPRRRMVSTFYDLNAAEWAISETIRKNAPMISAWTKAPIRDLDMTTDVGKNLGFAIVRSTGKRVEVQKVIVIMRHKTYNGMPYYFVTAYLE
jgi:hypothetical protein